MALKFASPLTVTSGCGCGSLYSESICPLLGAHGGVVAVFIAQAGLTSWLINVDDRM